MYMRIDVCMKLMSARMYIHVYIYTHMCTYKDMCVCTYSDYHVFCLSVDKMSLLKGC